ncbi:unnamed protein product, partial [Plutella xylostella]
MSIFSSSLVLILIGTGYVIVLNPACVLPYAAQTNNCGAAPAPLCLHP